MYEPWQGLLKGKSKKRTTSLHEISYPLPSDAVWRKISLYSGRGKKEKVYEQGWTLSEEPLCKLCQTPCKYVSLTCLSIKSI